MKKKDLIKFELEKIANKKGGLLNPHDVVEFARNEKTALHSCFDWDNSEAAEKWRLHQARMLIRIVVNIIPQVDENKEYRMFVSLTPDRQPGNGYRPVLTVLSKDMLKAQMLMDAMSEQKAFRKKYETVRELCGVFKEIDKLELKIKKPALRRSTRESRVAA